MAQLLTMLPASRTLNFLIFAVCTSMILIALYMEHVMMLQPCGLCITQRVFVILVGLVCLAAALHNPSTSTRRNYAFLAASLCVRSEERRVGKERGAGGAGGECA